MKQKIVIKIQMMDIKSRTKAMKLAAGFSGVQSAAVEGEDMDQIVVTGDGVDSIALTKRLRKGMGRAILVSVAAVEESEEKLEPEPEAPSYVYCINEKGHYDEPHCIIL